MILRVLGKYGPYPAAGGACSCYLVEEGGTRILLDFGAGALAKWQGLADRTAPDAIVLSHLHYDHCSDMGVLSYMAGATIPVYAPQATLDSEFSIPHVPKFAITSIRDGMCAAIGALNLRFFLTRHPVPCYGMTIENKAGNRLVYTADTTWFDGLAELVYDADLALVDACMRGPHLCAEDLRRLAPKRVLVTHIHPDLTDAQALAELGHPAAEIAVEGKQYIV